MRHAEREFFNASSRWARWRTLLVERRNSKTSFIGRGSERASERESETLKRWSSILSPVDRDEIRQRQVARAKKRRSRDTREQQKYGRGRTWSIRCPEYPALDYNGAVWFGHSRCRPNFATKNTKPSHGNWRGRQPDHRARQPVTVVAAKLFAVKLVAGRRRGLSTRR